jgi:hypothetical protein
MQSKSRRASTRTSHAGVRIHQLHQAECVNVAARGFWPTVLPSVQDIKNKEIIAESKTQCYPSRDIGLLPFTSLLSLFNVNVQCVPVTMEVFNTFDLTNAPGENHTWSLTHI